MSVASARKFYLVHFYLERKFCQLTLTRYALRLSHTVSVLLKIFRSELVSETAG